MPRPARPVVPNPTVQPAAPQPIILPEAIHTAALEPEQTLTKKQQKQQYKEQQKAIRLQQKLAQKQQQAAKRGVSKQASQSSIDDPSWPDIPMSDGSHNPVAEQVGTTPVYAQTTVQTSSVVRDQPTTRAVQPATAVVNTTAPISKKRGGGAVLLTVILILVPLIAAAVAYFLFFIRAASN
jgi:hypothetical protein